MLDDSLDAAALRYLLDYGLGPHLFTRLHDYLPSATRAEIELLGDGPEFDPERVPEHYDLYEFVENRSGKVVLSPEEAREVADHLADYDITAQLSDKEDGRPEEAVEWGRELRHRARDARDDG
jgi:hypothetical protein